MNNLFYALTDETTLAAACLPFVKGGGLFLKTTSVFALMEPIMVELQLLNEPEPLKFMARVVWLTPSYERDQLPQGVGIQFIEEDAKRVRDTIESVVSNAFALSANSHFF